MALGLPSVPEVKVTTGGVVIGNQCVLLRIPAVLVLDFNAPVDFNALQVFGLARVLDADQGAACLAGREYVGDIGQGVARHDGCRLHMLSSLHHEWERMVAQRHASDNFKLIKKRSCCRYATDWST